MLQSSCDLNYCYKVVTASAVAYSSKTLHDDLIEHKRAINLLNPMATEPLHPGSISSYHPALWIIVPRLPAKRGTIKPGGGK
jgi:hypothetical protein